MPEDHVPKFMSQGEALATSALVPGVHAKDVPTAFVSRFSASAIQRSVFYRNVRDALHDRFHIHGKATIPVSPQQQGRQPLWKKHAAHADSPFVPWQGGVGSLRAALRGLGAMAVLCVAAHAWAAQSAQVLDVRAPDLDVLVARASDHDVNRIKVVGARIVTAVAKKTPEIGVDKDDATGQIFLRIARRPDGSRPNPFTLYLVDDRGRSYTLRIVPRGIPGQTILVRPARRAPAERPRAEPRVLRIKKLIKAAALGDVPRRCDYVETGRTEPWWPGTSLREVARWDCGAWSVWRYRLANVGSGPMRLDERWFYHDGVVAVAVDVHRLRPGQATAVYVIRAAHDE
ncbi:MAG: hypothetical protein D6760_02205 [Deltaproteobacteria bacterium]|nr:MAG: hypothetical protein D6760_02205 [Deltaproteobacteria bacterium]